MAMQIPHRSVQHNPLFYFSRTIQKIMSGRKFTPPNDHWLRHYNLEVFMTLANFLYASGDIRKFVTVANVIATKERKIIVTEQTPKELARKVRVFQIFVSIINASQGNPIMNLTFSLPNNGSSYSNENLLKAFGDFEKICAAIGFDKTISNGKSINKFEFNKQLTTSFFAEQRNDKRPAFTVITSVHKKNSNLELALNSIRYQTEKRLEHIIVVDQHCDDLVDFLESYSREDPRVRLIYKALPLGTYNSRNLALSHSSGKYVLANDSDDILRADALEKMFNLFGSSNLMGIIGLSLRITDQNQLQSPDHEGMLVRLGFPTFCFDSDIVSEVGHYDTARHSADSEFIARARLAYPDKIAQLNEVLLLQADGPGNLTRTVSLGHAGYLTSRERRDYRNKYRSVHETIPLERSAEHFTSLSSIL